MRKYIKYLGYMLVLVALAVLYACGGGDSGGDVTPPVVVVPDEEVINSIVVPPVPDPVEDAASIGGVDTNDNIVRDSVERMLAEEFGDDPVSYEQAKEYAIAEQVAIMDPTPENIAAYDRLIVCEEDDQLLDDLEKVDDLTIDTKERTDAYIEAFAGTVTVITDEGC